MILKCIKKSVWDLNKDKKEWGEEELQACGFIHCSTIELLLRVTPKFKNIDEEMVILFIDENKLVAKVKYEYSNKLDGYFPHIYGLINNSAVDKVLPYIKDNNNNCIINRELLILNDK